MVKLIQSKVLLLALGGNIAGSWGAPRATLERAVRELESAGIKIVHRSNLYRTQPLGVGRQPPYLNLIVAAEPGLAPAVLLRLAKRIEQRAGRRLTPPMHSRPLDIDILDYGGRRFGWPPLRRQRGRIILPHPQIYARAFVLVPLCEVAPSWRHPIMGLSARTLLARLTAAARAGVSQALDFAPGTCEKNGC